MAKKEERFVKVHSEAMGGRMMRSWLEKPLLDPIEICGRQAAVEALVTLEHSKLLRTLV